jgi:hypothetical protein
MNTLEKLMQADALLSEWLTDNTEEDFNEHPEVDEARTLIQDAIDLQEAAPDMLKALYRITHPAADESDLEFALQVIEQATGGAR